MARHQSMYSAEKLPTSLSDAEERYGALRRRKNNVDNRLCALKLKALELRPGARKGANREAEDLQIELRGLHPEIAFLKKWIKRFKSGPAAEELDSVELTEEPLSSELPVTNDAESPRVRMIFYLYEQPEAIIDVVRGWGVRLPANELIQGPNGQWYQVATRVPLALDDEGILIRIPLTKVKTPDWVDLIPVTK